jgi:hypothetical protein
MGYTHYATAKYCLIIESTNMGIWVWLMGVSQKNNCLSVAKKGWFMSMTVKHGWVC